MSMDGITVTAVEGTEPFESGLNTYQNWAAHVLSTRQTPERFSFAMIEATKQIILGQSQWFRFDANGKLVAVDRAHPHAAVPLSDDDLAFLREAFTNPAQAMAQLDALLTADHSANVTTLEGNEEDAEAALQDDVETNDPDDTLENDPRLSTNRRVALQTRAVNANLQRQFKQLKRITYCLDEDNFEQEMKQVEQLAEEERPSAPKLAANETIEQEGSAVDKGEAREADAARLSEAQAILADLKTAAQIYPDAAEKLAALRQLQMRLDPANLGTNQSDEIKAALAVLLKPYGSVAVEGGTVAIDPQALALAMQAFSGNFPPLQPV